MSELVNSSSILVSLGMVLQTWSDKLAILQKYDCNENGIYDDKIIRKILSENKNIDNTDIIKYNNERFYSRGKEVVNNL